MSGKRKRIVVSLETKYNAIKRLDKGETIKKVAADLGVGEVTVGDWKRKRNEIEKWIMQSASVGVSDLKRKTMKKGEYEQTSEALFLWFCQMRNMGSPITGPMLQSKALQLHKQLKDGEENFTASDGWINRWKNKYGVRQLNISGEKLSADSSEIGDFNKKLADAVLKLGLTSEQLFNCDETGLNFRMLPSKTLAYANEKHAPGFKKSKDRVTALLCCNSSGTLKLKPLIIGKSKKPRAFKNLDMTCLPTLYTSQARGWMEKTIFSEWFFNSFVPVVEAYLKKMNLPRKALLLLDNAPSHPDLDELASGDIKCMFLPPNVTSLIQPLDQGVIETYKRNYRKRLLQVLLGKLEGVDTVTETLKKITVKDAVYWSAMAWDEVRNETLQRSWRKLFGIENPKKDDQAQQCLTELTELTNLANQLPVENQINNEDIQQWLKDDDQNLLTDEELISIVTSNQGEEEKGDDDDKSKGVPKVSHAEGLKRIEAALEYIEQQEDSTEAEIMMLQRWRYTSAKKRNKTMTQKTIADFFKK